VRVGSPLSIIALSTGLGLWIHGIVDANHAAALHNARLAPPPHVTMAPHAGPGAAGSIQLGVAVAPGERMGLGLALP
jgi:hypothetical protein